MAFDAGYRSIGDAITGFEHYVHPSRLADATTLNPRRPESLVYRVDGDQSATAPAVTETRPYRSFRTVRRSLTIPVPTGQGLLLCT